MLRDPLPAALREYADLFGAATAKTEASNLDRNAVATGVASFLEDALNSKSANKHLRRANMLVMGKQVLKKCPHSPGYLLLACST